MEKPRHIIGALIGKVFEGDDGKLCFFAGAVERYDEEYKLYKFVYEDGDAKHWFSSCVVRYSTVLLQKLFFKCSTSLHIILSNYIIP